VPIFAPPTGTPGHSSAFTFVLRCRRAVFSSQGAKIVGPIATSPARKVLIRAVSVRASASPAVDMRWIALSLAPSRWGPEAPYKQPVIKAATARSLFKDSLGKLKHTLQDRYAVEPAWPPVSSFLA